MTRTASRLHHRLVAASLGAVAVTSIAGFLAASPAFAHAEVVLTSPEANTQVAAPPVIAVGLSEQIVLDYSTMALTDATGAAMAMDPTTLDPTGTSMEAAVPLKLCPGMYSVAWHALSVDGHETDGTFPFEVTDNLSEGAPVCDQGNGGGSSGGDTENPAEPVESVPATMTPEPRVTILAIDAQASGEDPNAWIVITGWSALAAGVLAGIVGVVVVFVKRRRVG